VMFGTDSQMQVWFRYQTTPGSTGWDDWLMLSGQFKCLAAEANANGMIDRNWSGGLIGVSG